jgi:hypothetical protein
MVTGTAEPTKVPATVMPTATPTTAPTKAVTKIPTQEPTRKLRPTPTPGGIIDITPDVEVTSPGKYWGIDFEVLFPPDFKGEYTSHFYGLSDHAEVGFGVLTGPVTYGSSQYMMWGTVERCALVLVSSSSGTIQFEVCPD